MLKKFIIPIFVFIFHLSFANWTTNAQPDVEENPFEVGGHVTFINLRRLEEINTFPNETFRVEHFGKTITGIGARFGYNINKYLAVEAEGNFFPEDHLNNEELGQKTQLFVGVKAGVRQKQVGVFAKARPGLMTFYELPKETSCGFSGLPVICGVGGQKNFALDLGGIVEFYPTSRTIIRLDLGDTIVRYRGFNSGFSGFSSDFIPATTKHNFQASIGFGFRF